MKKLIATGKNKLNQFVFATQIVILAASFPLISFLELSRSGTREESVSGKTRLETMIPKPIVLDNNYTINSI